MFQTGINFTLNSIKNEGGVVEFAFAPHGGSKFSTSIFIQSKELNPERYLTILNKYKSQNIAILSGIQDSSHPPLSDLNKLRFKEYSRSGIKFKNIYKASIKLDLDLKNALGYDARLTVPHENRSAFLKDLFLTRTPDLIPYIHTALMSGNGCHLTLKLKNLFTEDIEKWKRIYLAIKNYIEIEFCKNLISFDSQTSNASRLLRAPCSINLKENIPIKTEFFIVNDNSLSIDDAFIERALKNFNKESPTDLIKEKSLNIKFEKNISTIKKSDNDYKQCKNIAELLLMLKTNVGERNNSLFICANCLIAQNHPHSDKIYKLFYELLDQHQNDHLDYSEAFNIIKNVFKNKKSDNFEKRPQSYYLSPQTFQSSEDGKSKLIHHDFSWKIICKIFIKWINLGESTQYLYFNNQFYQYNSNNYVKIDEIEIKSLISKFLDLYSEIFFIKTGKNSNSEIFQQLCFELFVPNDNVPPFEIKGKLTLELDILALRNGFIYIKDLNQFPKVPLHSYNKNIFVTSILPYKFLPEKISNKLKTFLDSSVPDFEIQQCLQEFSGYSLTRSTIFEKCLLLIGQGGNGKGVFIDIIRKMVGEDYTSNINLDSIDPKNTFNLIEIYGKKINLAPDTNKCTITSQGLLKSMISGETISVNQKFKDFLKFNPTAKWIIGSNFMLKFQDSSDGMARRLLIVPFNKQFTDGEKNLKYKLLDYWLIEDELSGVLNWAIQGYNRLIQNNQFTNSQVSEKEIDNFKNYQNPIREFALELFEECSHSSVPSQEAYDLYRKFCASNGIYNPLAKSQFTIEMKFLFKKMHQHKDATPINYLGQKIRDRLYLGIRLKIQKQHNTTQ